MKGIVASVVAALGLALVGCSSEVGGGEDGTIAPEANEAASAGEALTPGCAFSSVVVSGTSCNYVGGVITCRKTARGTPTAACTKADCTAFLVSALQTPTPLVRFVAGGTCYGIRDDYTYNY